MSGRPVIVGMTGGIGSGKSAACRIFECWGHPVYYADDRAKWLMVHDPALARQITDLFGEDAYTPDGLNRKWISQKVFKNPPLLDKLNALVHPAVAEDFTQWAAHHDHETLLLYEAALLFERGGHKKMDFTLLVISPQELRIQRVLKRDPHRTREMVLDIMANQLSDEEKIPMADFVLKNDEKHSLIAQIAALYPQLTSRHK